MNLNALGGIVIVAPIVFALQAPPAQRSTPTGTALIVGRVVDGDTRQPVAAAAVVLRGPGGRQSKLTDDAGRFVFSQLLAGEVTLIAERRGYIDGELGARRPQGEGQPLALSDGQRVVDLEIPIWRHAVITGTVVDEAGEPLVNARVHVLRADYVAGRRRFLALPGDRDQTDDRGVFRVSQLPPGGYVVGVLTTSAVAPRSAIESRGSLRSPLGEQMSFAGAPTSRPGVSIAQGLDADLVRALRDTIVASGDASAVYPSTFFPAARSVTRADLIPLAAGEEHAGVTIQLAPEPASRVSGRLIGPDGPAGGVAVRLLPVETAIEPAVPPATTVSDASGRFTLVGVPAGDYRLAVLRIPRIERQPATSAIRTGAGTSTMMIMTTPEVSPDPTWWAERPVSVGDADVADLEVALTTGQRIRGRVEFEGEPPARPPGVSVSIESVDGARLGEDASDSRLTTQRDGTFTSPEFPPARVLVRASAAGEWHVKSITAAGRDVSMTPMALGGSTPPEVVVVMTKTPSRLTGQVRSAGALDGSTASVYVFPVDRSRWVDFGTRPRDLQSTRVGRNAGFAVVGLPAGDYFVAAIADDIGARWRMRDLLEQLALAATRVTIAEGEQRVVDVQIGRMR
jgi:hypothetical protein